MDRSRKFWISNGFEFQIDSKVKFRLAKTHFMTSPYFKPCHEVKDNCLMDKPLIVYLGQIPQQKMRHLSMRHLPWGMAKIRRNILTAAKMLPFAWHWRVCAYWSVRTSLYCWMAEREVRSVRLVLSYIFRFLLYVFACRSACAAACIAKRKCKAGAS